MQLREKKYAFINTVNINRNHFTWKHEPSHMTYQSQPSTLERDIEKTITLIFQCEWTSVGVKAGRTMWLHHTALLTCALASQQVLALRLVGVDGRDRDIIFSEGVQVLQNVGGLITAQDGLGNGRSVRRRRSIVCLEPSL